MYIVHEYYGYPCTLYMDIMDIYVHFSSIQSLSSHNKDIEYYPFYLSIYLSIYPRLREFTIFLWRVKQAVK